MAGAQASTGAQASSLALLQQGDCFRHNASGTLALQSAAPVPKVMRTSPADKTAPISTDVAAHLELGRRGEEWAAAYLAQQGYQIVAANFSLPVGRNLRGAVVKAEIDLIAYDGPILCFIEVKTRASDHFAPPQANVDRRKRRQIARAARAYRRLFGLSDSAYRYDVISVVLPSADDSAAPVDIEILRGFWEEKRKVMSHE